MRLCEFNGTNIDFDSAKIIIEQKCSNILKFYKENKILIYRGIYTYDSEILKTKCKLFNRVENRKPISINEETQKIIDEKLKDSGFKALRSNSFFCSGSRNKAKFYGTPYIIFPLNNFDYTWSTIISDFPLQFQKIIGYDKNDDYLRNMNIHTFNKTFGFKKDNLRDAILSNHEILIHGDIIAVDSQNKLLSNILGFEL